MESGRLCFFTATILEWKLLLMSDRIKNIIVGSFRFLVTNKRARIYGFVIMPNTSTRCALSGNHTVLQTSSGIFLSLHHSRSLDWWMKVESGFSVFKGRLAGVHTHKPHAQTPVGTPSSWNWNSRPMSNITQEYIFTEPIKQFPWSRTFFLYAFYSFFRIAWDLR